jgi:NAD(P)-dependent dehydrogenase (short-subunit alcohol dehydrogenase family)
LIPLERWGASEEIATTVRFLCRPGASYITGQTVHVLTRCVCRRET